MGLTQLCGNEPKSQKDFGSFYFIVKEFRNRIATTNRSEIRNRQLLIIQNHRRISFSTHNDYLRVW
jgi:hypothetical protein